MRTHAKSLATCAVILFLLVLSRLTSLAHGNERGEAKAVIGRAKVSINYGRPTLNGRDFTKMIRPGQLWRIGADAPTTIESDTDLDFGRGRVPKGKHILLARYTEPGRWSLVVSSKDVSDYEPSAKIAEIPLELQEAKDPAELVTIQIANQKSQGLIEIAWGTMRLKGSFTPSK